jgi:predicted GIY-YIG superfamily endonuclease
MPDHVLYRIYDARHGLLYVGITMSPVNRFRCHRNKSWWSEVTSIELQHFSSRQALAAAEALAITSESPRFNIAVPGVAANVRTYSLEDAAELMCGNKSASSVRWLLRQVEKGRASHQSIHGQIRMSEYDINDLLDKCSNQPPKSDWVKETAS